ncbi:MAG TPA: cytochrome c [Trinickia sp.]|jgi:mono/diheme cytochrome c family protein|uniref:cytochrome c n=1 Tax=Trinickia sp. TaxID=2571163 RepID=UPI002D0B04A0|nr:cytochrome c [Trinickia sp.]HTI16893.1 cytochrome c [Trinickia sp.]
MNVKRARIVLFWGIPVLLGALVAITGARFLRDSASDQAQRQAKLVPPVHFTAVNVTLPGGSTSFPPGKGSEIANANCVMCHSTGMVLHQPPLTVGEWAVEINKMRNAFGAPLPADQVEALAQYLRSIDGREPTKGPSAVDKQAS